MARPFSRSREKRCLGGQAIGCAPWLILPQDGVEDREQLSGDGDERNELGYACGDEPVSERLEERVVTGRDHCAEKEGAAHALATAVDESSCRATGPTASSKRNKPGQGGDLHAVTRPRSSGMSATRCADGLGRRPARRRQGLLLRRHRRTGHMIVDLAVNLGELFLERHCAGARGLSIGRRGCLRAGRIALGTFKASSSRLSTVADLVDIGGGPRIDERRREVSAGKTRRHRQDVARRRQRDDDSRASRKSGRDPLARFPGA